MVNRNGSNNGTHEAAAVAARNGNGHKPDAAIPGEHDLLWDGLPPAVIEKLGQPLDPALVSQRKGRGGRTFDYLEGHAVIDQANAIFGYGGLGIRGGRRRDPAPHRDGRFPDRRGQGPRSATAPRCGSPWRAHCPAPTSASTR